jgi:hypothetical protein
MQKILGTLAEDDRILRDESGVRIVDPLERLALRMIGTRMEWRAERIGRLLDGAETGISADEK